jgi:putative ABC transport system substrate-binding protein
VVTIRPESPDAPMTTSMHAPWWTARGHRTALHLAFAALLFLSSFAVQSQQAVRQYRIGIVSPISLGPPIESFRQGLREAGYIEGKNVVLETRFADGHLDRLPQLVNEVIGLNVDVLVVGSTVAAVAAKRATSTVPIVFAGLTDPLSTGIVASLARPGGNITGATFGVGASGFGGKWVQLLHEVMPKVAHVAVLSNSGSPLMAQLLGDIRAAARSLNIKVDIVQAGNTAQLDDAFATIGSSAAQALIVPSDPFFVASRVRIVQFAATRRLPAMYFTKLFADAGGLMAYGSSLEDSYRRSAAFVDKILKGATPAELPIEQPTTFELVINMRTARALGLSVPRSVLVRADHVIE